MAPHTAGEPMSEQRWLNCRLVDIQELLSKQGYRVHKAVISRILKAHKYRLLANLKRLSSKHELERDRQFSYIQSQQAAYQAAGQPVISVDTKKKEVVGNFKNAGQIWCQQPEAVDDHDFPQDALGPAVPYGIYDLWANCDTVSVGQSADIATFAVDTIAHWCATELRDRYPHATHLLIEADSGASNSARSWV